MRGYKHKLTREEGERIARLSDVQVAYLAGLLDGEGSIECQLATYADGGTRFRLRISFVFATREPLASISRWLCLTPTRYKSREAKRQAHWRLAIPRRMAVPLLSRCLPHLILKRDQAQLFLDIDALWRSSTPLPGSRMSPADIHVAVELHNRLKSLKLNKGPRKEVTP